jgi:hypothetical protein
MVQAHAMAHGVETTRVTRDVDATVRVEAGAYNYGSAAAVLMDLGYSYDESTRWLYRFTRGDDEVDLMVADHERPPPRFARKDVLPVAGGRQALGRLQVIRFRVGNRELPLPVPTLHGALVLKAAAHIIDSRDRDRHLEDAITLLACIVDIGPIVSDLRGSDRRRLTKLITAIDGQPLVAVRAPSDTVRLAQRTVDEFRVALR